MPYAISFENVSKHYRGARMYRSLRDDLMAGVGRLAGRRAAPRGQVVALDNVSFDIEMGDSFAMIGVNGAGKTTALKLATRISYPTTGKVRVRGRVGALIEVGTGMHPELSGRENVRLYGRILGLSGRQVESRFDQIVEFAGIEAAIDRPVKQYSSGMQLRLGFSVAAHLEPDVLLVDEAIAVGDAGFQYKCVQRMTELVKEGRTLVFVSHDMSAIETLCARAILLADGAVIYDGPAREAVRQYLLNVHAERLAADAYDPITGFHVSIPEVTLHDGDGNEASEFRPGDALVVRLHYDAPEPVPNPLFTLGLLDGRLGALSLASMMVDGNTPEVIHGRGYVECRFEHLPLLPRTYEIWGAIRNDTGVADLVPWQRLRLFRVLDDNVARGRSSVSYLLSRAPVTIPYQWRFSNDGDDRRGSPAN